jgi:hypothetical protein
MQSAAELQPLKNQLAIDQKTGLPLSQSQPPMGLLRLRQGINSDFIGRWTPNSPKGPVDTAKGVYGTLSDEFHNAVPAAKDIDQRVSSLIPVSERAGQADLNAGILQRTMGRIGKPTGALAGAVAGGLYGKQTGGTPADIARDAAFGLVAPEIITNPTTLMGAARVLNSPLTSSTVRALAGSGASALSQKKPSLYGSQQ